MIPKIAHFHWEGRPINWLRMMSIYSFARLNPRWEIRLHRTPEFIRERKLPNFANEADWTWLYHLYESGGFALPTDTVFVKPMPDEWVDCDICVCTHGTDDFFHNTWGVIPGTELVADFLEECEKVSGPKIGYQDMGVTLLSRITRKMGRLKHISETDQLELVEMPVDGLTPVLWSEPEKCWAPDPLPITDNTVGVVWFGGHPMSKEYEWEAREKHADSAIVKLAERMCP